MQKESIITLRVGLSENKTPQSIHWSATDSSLEQEQEVKAMLLGVWDGKERSALRIDLWTTQMRMDEMNDFYFQTIMGMADTYARANKNEAIVNKLKTFAKEFYKDAQDAIK